MLNLFNRWWFFAEYIAEFLTNSTKIKRNWQAWYPGEVKSVRQLKRLLRDWKSQLKVYNEREIYFRSQRYCRETWNVLHIYGAVTGLRIFNGWYITASPSQGREREAASFFDLSRILSSGSAKLRNGKEMNPGHRRAIKDSQVLRTVLRCDPSPVH